MGILVFCYLAIRTSHYATSFYVNRMQLMESFFCLFFAVGVNLPREGILHDLRTKIDLLAVEARWVLHRRTSYEETNVSFIIFLTKALLCWDLEKHAWLVSVCDVTAFLLTFCVDKWHTGPITVQGETLRGRGWRNNTNKCYRIEEEKRTNQTVCVWIHTEKKNQ